MAKYRKKPVVIEAITFDEFVEYGKILVRKTFLKRPMTRLKTNIIYI